jgi:G8 domain
MQGDKVFIPPGWNLLVDVDTPKLAELWIDGGAVTVTNKGCTIQTGYLVIRNNGTFYAGSAAEPYAGSLNILLHGQRDSEVKAWSQDVVIGAKALAVVDGALSLYGTRRARAVPLGADAATGAEVLELSEAPTGWQVGDAIAITSTDFNPDAEERTITGISGTRVALSGPLARTHNARRWIDPRGTHNVDMRARVLNLASNIVVAAADGAAQWAGGDPGAGAKYGARVLVAGKGRAQLNNVALRYCGQFGEERGCLQFQGVAPGSSFFEQSATAYGARPALRRACNVGEAAVVLLWLSKCTQGIAARFQWLSK